MEIKICGLADTANITEVVKCQPDYMGFIFYAKSKRYIGPDPELSAAIAAINNIPKVGVFVNATVADIKLVIKEYKLDLVQLHGDESSKECAALAGVTQVIKAFRLHRNFDFQELKAFDGICKYFLFDTPSEGYGGTGRTFDWTLLQHYRSSTPYFLSGGITISHIIDIRSLGYEMLHGVDMSSKLEDAPGIKNIQLTQKAIYEVRH